MKILKTCSYNKFICNFALKPAAKIQQLLIVAAIFKKINVRNFFYFTKGQRRGIMLFIALATIFVLIRWVI